jgi:tetratricopeptide (TPR) repeat protein
MFRALICFLLLTALPAHGQNATNASPTATGVAAFRSAYQTWDGEEFTRACQLLQQATVQAPDNATNFYWLGVAEFHRMLQLQSSPGHDDEASSARDAAQTALLQALKLDPHQAECHALLGSIYGIRIGENWLRAIYLGPRAKSQCDDALADGPKNPRVRYLLGSGEFYMASKPAGWRKALDTFLLAEKFFETEKTKPPASPLEPRWGLSSCRTFIGMTYEKLGDRAKAADYFREALAEHPADQRAREGLNRVAKTQTAENHHEP